MKSEVEQMTAKMEFANCVLCGQSLRTAISWGQLFERRFSTSKCDRCASKFQLLHQTIDDIYCLFDYNESMRDYIKRLKFMKDVFSVYAFHQEIHTLLSPFLKQKNTVIVPVPMHPKHLRERTFAHVDELLHAAQIPFEHVLEKISTERQSKKTRDERLNTKKLFKVNKDVRLKHMIIFDDIKTTGVTLHLAKNELLKAGAATVQLFALAGRRFIE